MADGVLLDTSYLITLAAGFDRAAFDVNGQSDFEDMLDGNNEIEP